MKASLSEQQRLLDLQALDTRIAQLDHRAAHLPEREAFDALVAEHSAADVEVLKTSAAAEDSARALTRAETDVQQVRDRAERTRARLEAGQGTPKELQAMQHEVESLARRQGTLEDEQLQAIERADGLRADADRAAAALEGIVGRLSAVKEELDGAVSGIVRERGALDSERSDLAAKLPAELVALYEKVRATSGGVGAAAMLGKRCGGCRLELGPIELREVMDPPEDQVVRCPDCRRIIVRTQDAAQ